MLSLKPPGNTRGEQIHGDLGGWSGIGDQWKAVWWFLIASVQFQGALCSVLFSRDIRDMCPPAFLSSPVQYSGCC